MFRFVLFICFGSVASFVWGNEPRIIENIAPKAKVSAQSEYSGEYLAKWATDGEIPFQLSRNDTNRAWAVRGSQGMASWFRFDWEQPQTVAEIVYYGRTAFLLEECFKDYELLLDGDPVPVLKGKLEMKHGPQRITLPEPKKVRSMTIRFLNAYTTTTNPGASEIAVFSESPSMEQLVGYTREKQTEKDQNLFDSVVAGKFGFDKLLLVQRHHLSTSHVYTYHVEGYQPGGGLFVFTPSKNPGEQGTLKKIVDSPDGMIIDANLHWNGREIIFSWKRGKKKIRVDVVSHLEDLSQGPPEENYQLWTVNVDGTDLKQLTNTPYNNLNACWLPDGGIAFISDRKPAYAYCYVVTSPVLYRMDRDGSNQKRLSANYLMDFTPSVLNDGRIIFTRWEYVDRPAIPIQSLWTINPDGTNLSGFFGNRILAPGTFMDARAIAGSQKVISLATNHNGDCVGGIVVIDRSHGPNAKEGVVVATPEVDVFDPGDQWGNCVRGSYEKPYPLNETTFLVTKSGAIQVRETDGTCATLLNPDFETGLGYYSVQPIRTLPVPPIAKASTMDESIVLPEDGSVSGNWAVVAMQDVYNGLEPAIKRGEVKQIAVVQEIEKSMYSPQIRRNPVADGIQNIAVFGFQFPLVSCGATYSAKKVWGYAEVAEDGSACFKVPSEVPIYFLALDAEGQAVQRMRTFTHLMPGEVQGCVGCHTDRNMVTPPRDHILPQKRAPQDLITPDWGVKGFSYREVVQPVWDRNCVQCHNPKQQDGSVDLTADYTDFFNVSYEHLARKGTLGEKHFLDHGVRKDSRDEGENPYTKWIWTINGAEWNILEIAPKRWGSPASPLVELIRTGHPDASGKKRVDVSLEDRKKVNLWIDLNVPYYPTSSSNHRDQMGCRQMYPLELDATLKEVGSRRCAECHSSGVPREFYTRFMNPENNAFLLAPLAKKAGGTQKCSKVVFASTDDPDYCKIIETFNPVRQLIKQRPREDMPEYLGPICTQPVASQAP